MFKAGKIVGAYKLPTGTIVVPDDVGAKGVALYARVSSSQNKANLETQADRLAAFCAAKGWIVERSVKEVGSGINDKRPKLLGLLRNPPEKLVIEHKDRLTRFGFEYLVVLLKQQGCEIVVINETSSDQEDLMQDFISIITSFCARIYGQRRTRRCTEKLIEELTQ